MSNYLDILLFIRKAILLGSKVTAIIFCIYYIYNVQNYQVSWSLLNTIFPSYTATLNQLLSSIGTYILIIPLSIIITSMLLPKNQSLHTISSLFGVSALLFSTLSGLRNQALGEISNFRFFTVNKILSLNEKREIFLIEYKRIASESYSSIIKTYNYLLEMVTPIHYAKHDLVLNNLKNNIEIKEYASNVIKELVSTFTQVGTEKVLLKYFLYGSGALLTVLVICTIANNISLNDVRTFLGKFITVVKNTAELSAEQTKNNLASNINISALGTVVANGIGISDSKFTEIGAELISLKTRQNTTETQVESLSNTITVLLRAVNQE